MLRKAFWSVFSLLMVVLLILVSCGPRAAPAPTPTLTPAPTPVTPATPALTPAPTLTPTPATSTEKPKYGGTINLMRRVNTTTFMPGVVLDGPWDLGGFIYEQLTSVDWSKGPAGTGETTFGDFFSGYGAVRWEDVQGSLVESFETPEVGVWILNIRRGVHWALDPNSEASRLANGREMTADDIVWSINYMNKQSDDHIALDYIQRPGHAKALTVEKTGPWQVTVRAPVDSGITFLVIMGGSSGGFTYPKEVVEKYGKTNEWRNVVGTGPYMLTDFVSGSALTFIRNPNYWRKNPLGPGKGDQLPYPAGLKIFIIPDLSTRLAAMRTGKADWIEEVQWEDAQGLLKTNPSVQAKNYLPYLSGVAMRIDKPDLPYKDVRVRQALHMAIDFEAIQKDMYRGYAELFTFPVSKSVGTKKLYIPLEELPESAKTLFKYNPERAKQLLAEAGYPNGFKAKIIVQNVFSDLDMVSIIKATWAKVGVDLEIQPKEATVWRSIRSARSYEEMFFTTVTDLSVFSHRYGFSHLRGPQSTGYVNDPFGKDPVMEAAFQEMSKYVMINWPKADEIIRGLVPYIVEQAYYIVPPAPYTYRLWQPWLKNYYGEAHPKHFIPYPWVDQDLKEQMTGRR